MEGDTQGKSGVDLWEDIREDGTVAPRNGTIMVKGKELTVVYEPIPYVKLRAMLFKAQRGENPEKTAMELFQDAALLASIKTVDGVTFTPKRLLSMRAETARGLVSLLGLNPEVDEGESGGL